MGLLLISIVVYLMWVHRAYANLSRLRVDGLNHTPGIAVVSYFIPLVNVVRGCTIMQEIWKGSDPDRIATNRQWQQGSAANVVLWWILYLAASVTDWIGGKMTETASQNQSMDGFAAGEQCLMFSTALFVVAGLILISILLGVTRRQEQRYAALHESGVPE